MLAFYLTLLEEDDDKALFRALFERHERKLYAVALKLLGSQAQAEDALQESWLKVLKSFSKVKEIPRNEIGRWLVIVVKNAAIDILRREGRDVPDALRPQSDAADGVDAQAGYRALVALIRAMPPEERRVLELRFVLQYSNVELARALGISENAAASRVFRARKKLIERLREEGYGDEL